MSKIALVVEFTLRDGVRDEFLEVIRGHAAGTKADEEGCLQFDVLIPEEGENKVMLGTRTTRPSISISPRRACRPPVPPMAT